ncbi:molybdopterin molybdenumtransferase MoeA [Marinitenerispora sediminis]|uniref:Molybdopterin molybdenumtransferase n=1 Tax=Marinitenerispora sediminis TaxID=1931232 RepID=A0A368T3S2_9ACTN|nr:molybdopterin molybdenumtransferase MoeA [Marinitenerispora sediminis]RCV52592.1 molybdopterin molybdenumtransferase MoeA [Marinitenerispora sediminis]RCV56866.1 molybdopterin molybdenumtransferase MoeA [Marinitenerispora sediminis]
MPWERARAAARRLGERSRPGAAAREPLAGALGATLAEDLVALVGIPSYDAAAMDGYAVAGAGPWTVVGRALAGGGPSVGLRPGQAVEIATGAVVPEGALAVLPYESARRSGRTVAGEVQPERHVRRRGEDTAAGTAVLPSGTVVTPTVLGLAASLGYDTLTVRRPRIAALVTGDEIALAGVPAPGAVRDAIGPMLPGLAAWAGARLDRVDRLADGAADLASALHDAARRPAGSVLVVCGASSRGPADHLRAVLDEAAATVLVDGVACRPGHPQLLAHTGPPDRPETLVVGLPGNPHAALAAGLTLLVPLLAALGGRPDPASGGAGAPPRLPVRGDVRPHGADTRLVPVRIDADGEAACARPVGHDRPGTLRGAAGADALAVLPPGWSGPDAELLWLPR